ncbi:MAG: molybdopterin-dependent oxidoreductase [Lachnospiraceae bacterium]|nr:molybdopterin-dependent oxidoreductase [Lachnospiraceae bacterium]
MNKFADKEYFRKPEDFRLISSTESKYTHVDAYEKVTGKAKYAGDFMAPNMLTAKVLHSPISRGRILSIDTSKAEALPGVKGVLTGKDFPIRITEDIEILCQGQVRMVGDPVVAVCAISEEIAEQALELIDVQYEEMPGVYDPWESIKDGAPDVQGYGYDNHNIGPTCHQQGSNDGKDIDEEFEKAAYVQHEDFKTHRIQHAPIEPHATFAEYDPEKDEWTVHQSTTMSFGDQFWLAHGFQKDVSHFHIIRPYVGGAFGSKSNWPYSEFIACEFARRTLRPVRFVQTREEEFQTMHGRHPFQIHIDTAFAEDGTILAKKADQIMDGGAYGVSHSQYAAVNLSVIWCAFPYKIDAIDFRSRRILTNTAEGGAMRGYTACQVQFAHDVNMQLAAERMGIDPIEFRKRSAMEPGYHSPAGLIVTSCSFKETLDDAAKFMRWEERKDKMGNGEGIGFAGTAFVSGTAAPVLNTPNQVQTNATVRVDLHGVVSLYSNCHDNGQGADTVMTAIVAEELGLNMNEVKLIQPSTFDSGYDSGAYGSRVTFLGGNAVRRAAVDAKRQILEVIGAKWGCEPHLLDIIDHNIICRDMGKTDLKMSWAEAVYATMLTHGGDEVVGVGSYYHRTNNAQYQGKPSNYAPSYVFSTGACHLFVDQETGQIDIDEFFFAHDCGRALNKRAVEAQLEGSIYSGLGYAVYEELKINDKGRMMNPNFRDYRMITALDMPHITTKFDYAPDPEGPFGAKECGEGTTAPIAPAVANAIHNATGLMIHELPLDPEHIWRLLKEQGLQKDHK